MAPGTVQSGQDDFGAGIYRGREAPSNAAYDLLNCLIDDEGQPFRRGGSAYKTTVDAAAALTGLADAYVAAGDRTYSWDASVSRLNVLNADDQTLSALAAGGATAIRAFARGVVVAGTFVVPRVSSTSFVMNAGSRKADYSTGTVSVTNGSRTVTGAGTSWLANVDPGMTLQVAVTPFYGVVESVDSNTQLTLVDGWTGATAAGAGYFLLGVFQAAAGGGVLTASTTNQMYLAAVGTVPRLVAALGNRAYFTTPGGHPAATTSWLDAALKPSYHELPRSALAIGAEGFGDTALIFTTSGVWAIANMDFDPIDDAGNVQHTVHEVSDLILWGDSGIRRWRGAVIVPAIDNVWLMSLTDAPIPIGDGIRPLYISYVKAGYQPGIAAVHRGHYFLPILNGTTLVDELVCRLDRGFAWTRWSGHGAGTAYAQRIGSTTRSPKLFSLAGLRIAELTDAWTPSASNASEADATTHPLTIETRDLSTGSGAKGATTRKVKVRYQATAAATPAFTVSYARGPEGAAYTSLGTAIRGGAASDGLDESVWPVGKQAPAIRFRISSTSALSTFTLREITAEYTPRGA